RVMTGAVMPPGTDTVVIQEVVRAEDSKILIPKGQKAGQNVRSAGEDLKIGVPVLAPGKLLRPAELGLIASLGLAEVRVRRRLRVAFFSTGDELASVGAAVGEDDFTKELMAKVGEVLFWKIAMRPGRPMAFGKIGQSYLFGLPGNPVAVMVTFYAFVRGALLHLSGRTDDYELPLLKAT